MKAAPHTGWRAAQGDRESERGENENAGGDVRKGTEERDFHVKVCPPGCELTSLQ